MIGTLAPSRQYLADFHHQAPSWATSPTSIRSGVEQRVEHPRALTQTRLFHGRLTATMRRYQEILKHGARD